MTIKKYNIYSLQLISNGASIQVKLGLNIVARNIWKSTF